jgi:molecular chaperone GrpE
MIKSKKDRSGKDKEEVKEVEIPITDANDEAINEESAGTTEEANPDSSLEKQVSDLRDTLLRKVAEFENYKRRTDAEKAEYYGYANERLIRELLPVLDDFQRALKAYDENHDPKSLKKGVELVNDKFTKILEKQGLKEIDSTGKDFDVNLHEALMQQPTNEIEPNKVLDTVEKGYHLGDKVLRHAKFIVSSKPE